MKAMVCTRWGAPEALQMRDLEKPTPKDNEVLVKIHATAVTAADCYGRRADSFLIRLFLGLRKPRKILGSDFSGVIESTGKNVRRLKAGDQVYGFAGFCLGSYAEYSCLPETASLVHKPTNLSFEEAAAVVDGASTALFFLKDKAKIQKGQKVLINGASGSIGSFAVQLARYYGAAVTGVCSGANVEWVKSLGADRVIDYTQEDFTKNDERYDIVFDTVNKSSFTRCKPILKPKGIYLGTALGSTLIFQTLWTRIRGGKRAIFALSIEKTEALLFIKELVEKGHLKPVIDRRYHLEQLAEAHRYVDQGHKKGNVVIAVGSGKVPED